MFDMNKLRMSTIVVSNLLTSIEPMCYRLYIGCPPLAAACCKELACLSCTINHIALDQCFEIEGVRAAAIPATDLNFRIHAWRLCAGFLLGHTPPDTNVLIHDAAAQDDKLCHILTYSSSSNLSTS